MIDFSEINDNVNIYSQDGECVGVENRGIVHNQGFLHYAVHCWVFGEYNNRLSVIFQKRKGSKRLFPRKFDVAAAGHYTENEFGRDGLRELEEELKIPLLNYDVAYYKTISCKFCSEEILNNELCNVYLCRLKVPFEKIAFAKEEIEDLIFVDVYKAIELLSGNIKEIFAYSVNQKQRISIAKDEFVESYVKYFIDILTQITKSKISTKKTYENYTFIMLKPDAIKRKLVPNILEFLISKGYRIEIFDIKSAYDEIVYQHYKDKIAEEGEVYKIKAHKYFYNEYVVPIILSHPRTDIIAYTREVIGYKDPSLAQKNTVRGLWGTDSMKKADEEIRCCENLIHASDSYESFKREAFLWFKRSVVEKYFF